MTMRKPLEKSDVRIVGLEFSGDGETWGKLNAPFMGGGFAGEEGLVHFIDLLSNGERIFIRATIVDVYTTQRTSMPRVGGIYELKLVEMQAARQLIETRAEPQKLTEGPEK